MRARRWSLPTPKPELERSLAHELEISPLAARVLVNRGVNSLAEARGFLKADIKALTSPDLFPGMPRAVQRLTNAIAGDERIVIYGDYDVDGLTGASLLHRVLQSLGGHSEVWVPDRLTQGYGLNTQGMARLLEEKPGVLVTVDHGISAIEQVKALVAGGVDVVITDHHQRRDELPPAYAIVHPALLATETPVADLSGAGVAFKLACAVFQAMPSETRRLRKVRDALRDALAYAALGTVADLVPLRGENRLLVRHGLERLMETEHAGLSSLRDRVQQRNKPLDAEDISFGFGPRLNAAGRMGQVELARELLSATKVSTARELTERIEALNLERREVEARVLETALERAAERPADDPVLVLADEAFHVGVMGIVASRLVERYARPVVLIALAEPSKGSGRSVRGFNLGAAFQATRKHLTSHGGHAAAAGLEMRAADVPAFRDALIQHAHQVEMPTEAAPIAIDSEVRLQQINRKLLDDLSSIGPFGEGNPKPVFAASRVEHAVPPRRVGADGQHLLMKLRYPNRPISAIAFRQGDRIDEVQGNDVSIVFSPRVTSFPGGPPIELIVLDVRAEDTLAATSSSSAP